MELKHLIIGLAIAFLSYIFVESRRPKAGVQEPPALRTKIPFIGHIIGIAIHGLRYFGKACEGSDEPIVTIDFLVSKVYLVNKSSAVAQVQRNAKVITFDPFLDSAAERMVNVSKRGLKLLTGKENGGGDLNRKSVDELASFSGKSFDLYAWAKHAITIASTDAVWGPKNPIKDPENEAAFWDFDSHLRLLVVSAFVKYYNEGGQHEASELAQARWRVQHESGAATEDIARMETATVLGVVSNTTPSSFWMLYDVYSRPALLSQLRDEVREHALKKNESGEMTIDLAAMRDNCPNLLATFQEVLRTHSNSAPTRFVTDDVKGRVLLMPGMNMNYEPSIWGDDSQKFDPTRFKKETLKQRPTSFMSFGASPSLCPGRHFASGEILGMAAMMILRYDITPASGKWTMPKFWKGAIAASMPFPAEPFNVTITPRDEFANTTWSYKSTDGKGKFPLITG
ncbi:unnamed protein product [Aureobasidium pullulans]|nr:unnamed protein product [Aureobasidium pullulans]